VSDDRDAIAELVRASNPGQKHAVLHYLYFPREGDARLAASELRRQGFLTEDRLGADGVNWLVLARHSVVPSEATIASARRLMESLVQPCDGEYDGWEAEVG
jgi:hypothetical protein